MSGGGLMGGSEQSSKSGYSALSPQMKKAFDPFATAINYFTLPEFGAPNNVIPGQANTYPKTGNNNGQFTINGLLGGKKNGNGTAAATDPTTGGRAGVTDMFTPLAQTDDETRAFEMMRQGFTPTEESIRRDTAMQMNPYMDSVIAAVNRQGQGQYSMMNQEMANAGQSGSNRSILGANDIDQTRQMTIGQLMGTQFNNSLNNAMTVLPGQRAQDAAGLLGIGDFMRSLDTQTKQAPITAMQTGLNMMGAFTSGNNQSSQSTTPGILPMLMSYAGTRGTTASDPRLKENIIPAGKESGFNLYEFNYIGNPQRYVGVMADEVAETRPDAVEVIGGYLAVNYPKINVTFKAIQ
jgi:hypothetical protein